MWQWVLYVAVNLMKVHQIFSNVCVEIWPIAQTDRRDGVVVRASASQSVDLGFIPLVESYQKTF